ncbi:MAG: proline--tRNA ligase [Oscillospiraceae bacterium]|jgi:prolyl-tRNA synthetase|nr:proline--tRNA ligase [Oscillospiraceae bacterium]
MLMSRLLGSRYKEWPAIATSKSHGLLLRGGYIRQVAAGIYSLLPLAQKVSGKIIDIVKQEMNRIDFDEVLMPVIMPRELWDESGRYESVGDELVRFKDRAGHEMLLGMTHEEAVVHLVRGEATTYAKYPVAVYQVQTKVRDEPRARGGLIRVREFLMKDAYSFHTNQEDLDLWYQKCFDAYEKIFKRVGLKGFVAVESDTGMMGGSGAHEFMLLCEIGEDSIALCGGCGYKANVEVANGIFEPSTQEAPSKQEEIATPGIKTIEDLQVTFGMPAERVIKACVFDVVGREKPVIVFIRGDMEVNEVKLKSVLQSACFPRTAAESDSLCYGYIGPIGLSAGSYDLLFDESLQGCENMVCGANKVGYHLKGVNLSDLVIDKFWNLYKVASHLRCPVCKKTHLEVKNGIEIGNIFKLGDKYTRSMDMTYVGSDGEAKYPIMGCYGIGIGRLMASVIEEHHDDNGPIWPVSIAPFAVQIIAIDFRDPNVRRLALELYDSLRERVDVLLDDRDLSAGVQFCEADLVAAPVRVVISPKGIASGDFEVATRDKQTVCRVEFGAICSTVLQLLDVKSATT